MNDILSEGHVSHKRILLFTYKVKAQTMQREANAGHRYTTCTCDDHRNVYADLPWTDTELEIAPCMRTCPYCGDQFKSASNLRAHLKGTQYRQRNITVKAEKAGHRLSSPKWSSHNLFSATSIATSKDMYVYLSCSWRVNQAYQVLKADISIHIIYTSWLILAKCKDGHET